jgi:hypothetical protein
VTRSRPTRIAHLLFVSLAVPAGAAAQEDGELARQVFIQAFGAAPAVSGSTVSAGGSPAAIAAIEAGRSAVASPADNRLRAEFTDRLSTFIESEGGENIMETLFVVVKESVSELDEEKKYWLDRLSEQNTMSERLSEYMKELSDAGQELSRIQRAGQASTATVPVTVRTFDPVWLDTLRGPPTGMRATVCDPCLATRETSLNAEQIQREQESVLGILRHLQGALEDTSVGRAEIERRSDEVIGMLVEILRNVDEERDEAIRRARLDATS